jgi:hypothetical protein
MTPIVEVLMSDAGEVSYRIKKIGLGPDAYGAILSDLLAHFAKVLSDGKPESIDFAAVSIAVVMMKIIEVPPSERLTLDPTVTLQ